MISQRGSKAGKELKHSLAGGAAGIQNTAFQTHFAYTAVNFDYDDDVRRWTTSWT